MKKFHEYVNFLLESAPRLPKDVNYWLKKGKSGKNVCLIIHDDFDGICSGIIMKNYLEEHGFKIKQIGVINYQLGWKDFKLDPALITIALDFADSIPGVSVYIDHHGKFEDEIAHSQKLPAIKTDTGSAAEGIAQQLGVPFSNDTKDWIDMIDSAKYNEYDIDVKGILDFDLKTITKSPHAKLKFAAAFNQLLKRSDHKTFIEVVNASKQPSIYNIYRLFKLFYPKNNPNFRTGDEPDFVGDAKIRLAMMQKKTKGGGTRREGFDKQGKKIRYTSFKDFWNDFAVSTDEVNDQGKPLWQVQPGVYQLIGNIMYVPSGTWANALRAKAIFDQDLQKGIVPDDPKLNFVLLQYGNTLQIADLNTKIKNMAPQDYPRDKNGNPIDDLGKYMEGLVKNFGTYLGYMDKRTVSGGHPGIGSISNIFGRCTKKGYEGVKFLDLFKNKIINDISGIKWGLNMPWNEKEDPYKPGQPQEFNKKLMDTEEFRSEKEATIERDEREILTYIIINDIKNDLTFNFNSDEIKKIYRIWLNTDFSEIKNDEIQAKELDSLYFNHKKPIEDSELFTQIVNYFGLNDIYNEDKTSNRDYQRKELKRIFKIIFNMVKSDSPYLNPIIYDPLTKTKRKSSTKDKVANWMK